MQSNTYKFSNKDKLKTLPRMQPVNDFIYSILLCIFVHSVWGLQVRRFVGFGNLLPPFLDLPTLAVLFGSLKIDKDADN